MVTVVGSIMYWTELSERVHGCKLVLLCEFRADGVYRLAQLILQQAAAYHNLTLEFCGGKEYYFWYVQG